MLALACVHGQARGTSGDGFEDHTQGSIDDLGEFRRLAAAGNAGTEVLKFVITDFSDNRRRRIVFLDSTFYQLHDEWYWFRLLNGARVPGAGTKPQDGSFADPRAATRWAKEQSRLPLDLRLIDGERLYSDRFYELAMDVAPRTLGVGSLVHMPAQSHPTPRPELWAFELQYRDPATEHELSIFFETLKKSLPASIGDSLVWIVRSPEQARVAHRLRERKRPLGSRIVDYAELAIPGALEIYSTGLVAGRLRSFTGGDTRLTQTRPTDILLLDAVPDFLPPAAGVITAVPQTPLAHIAILARNRGIPNAYLGGVMTDPNLQQLARVHAPVIVQATGDDLKIHPIDEAQYRRWRGMKRKPTHRVPGVDLRRAEYTVDLTGRPPSEAELLRPLVGGKAAGFLFLLAADTVTPPDRPLAVTIRAYAEHLRPLHRTIEAMLADEEFLASAKVRMLVLDGPEALAERFPDTTEFARGFGADRKHSAVLREIAAAGGLRRMIRDQPVDPRTLQHLEQALRSQFAGLAPRQGLRFRSSSTAEDIEGFTGAGLYESSTGFLLPAQQATKKDRKRSVAWALKRTWASYWSAEAFEERSLAGIDHMSGNMAVLVHPRFDDPLERANGVATFTSFLASGKRREVLEINVQAGALSVANPPTDRAVAPERIRVTRSRGARPRIERLGSSSEVGSGVQVMGDDTVLELFRQTSQVAGIWLETEARPSRASSALQAPRGVVLDLEFRDMLAGWPAMGAGQPRPTRLVIKQVRSLEPGLPDDPGVRALPVPREVLARASKIQRRSCRGPSISVELLEVFTDPLLAPDLGHAQVPFTAFVELRGLGRVSGLESSPSPLRLTHAELERTDHRPPGSPKPHVMATLGADAAKRHGFEALELDPSGRLSLRRAGRIIASDRARCAIKSEMSTPDGFLLELLQR